jgi:hypothetical protein
MTYLKPLKWWKRPFNFIAKTQSKTIYEQYEAGARVFDLRIVITYDKAEFYDEPLFAHGSMEYKSPKVDEILAWLNSRDETVYVRFLMERYDKDGQQDFIYLMEQYEKTYTNIVFWEAKDKKTWVDLYKFSGKLPCTLVDKYASCNQTGINKWKGILKSKNWSGLLIDDLWPWIYAKIHNKKYMNLYKDQDVILLKDFI